MVWAVVGMVVLYLYIAFLYGLATTIDNAYRRARRGRWFLVLALLWPVAAVLTVWVGVREWWTQVHRDDY